MGTLRPFADDANIPVSSKERGRKFRECRLSWGITQNALSEVAGIPQDLISLWEMGYGEEEPEKIERLSKALASLIDKKRRYWRGGRIRWS
jgi:transcriptional regulator with XRE-family HTH domain